MVACFVEGVFAEPGIVLFDREEGNFLGGATLVVGMPLCEPELDLAMFGHRENGSVHLDSSPESKVACSKSNASEDVGFESQCIVNFIKELCLEHS